MSDQWNTGVGAADTSSQNYPTGSSGDSPDERWLRRPRRSTGDRKIAGVAGGLGRAFGVDPVLIRVAFVVLTIFGGVGGLLYVLGWLLLPSDGDEVSAAEALLGRGRSSVPPPLAVALGVIAVISAFSMFSWGLPFLPLAIGGVIVLAIMRRRGVLGPRGEWSGGDWRNGPRGDWRNGPGGDWMTRVDEQVRTWGEQAEQWAGSYRNAGQFQGRRSGCGSRSWGRWAGPGTSSTASSPFERPAFWEQPKTDTRVDAPPPPGAAGSDPASTPPSGIRLTKPAAGRPTAAEPKDDDPVYDSPTPRTTPPAWDPLGVAPFAWDLPEPTPLAVPPAPVITRGPGVIGRVTMGMTLLAGGLAAAGVFAGWWALAWAQVAGIALAVLAVGLLIAALRGRGYSLLGPGVFLSLVTLALAITGISGTSDYGSAEYHPTTVTELRPDYTSNAGQLTLDLSSIKLEKGADKTVNVTLGGGHAEVIVPDDMNVAATCEAGVGHSDCLGHEGNGVQDQTTGNLSGKPGGTLHLNVKVNGGFAEVRTDA